MNNLIQTLNDKYLDLEVLLTEFDELLGNLVKIDTVYEGENGIEYGELQTLDEDGVEELRKLYDRLEEIVGDIMEEYSVDYQLEQVQDNKEEI